jgi:hypothetical protein
MSSSPRYNSYLRQIYKGSKKYDDYLSEIEPGEEGDGPGVLGTAADVGEQLLATSADFVLRSGKGVANIIGGLARGAGTVNPALKASIGTEQIADVADRTANRLQQQREDVFRYAPPDTKAGVGAAVLGGLGTEGVAYVATGGPVGKALGRAFGATTKAATKEAAKLPARMAGGLKEAGRDALAVAPLDATAAAVGAENSLAGVIGEYTGNELALDIAENPLLRGISESALGGFGDVLVRGAVGLRRLRNAKPLPKPEPRIPMPEVPEPAPRPEPVLRSPVADELTAQLERSREAAARVGREVADKAAADRAAAASQRRVAANTAQREAEQARAAERARLPKPDEISTTVEKPSSKPLALTPEIQYSVASSNAKDFSLPEPEVPQPRRNTTTMDRRTGERSLLGDLKALQRALPTAEADPAVRVLQLRAPGETDDVLSSLSNAASEVGAPSRAFHIGGEDYVMLAPADKADALLSRTREAGFSGSIGNTLREADEAMRAADLSAAQSRVKANGNGNGKVPAVEVPKVEVTEDVAPAAVATPAPVRETTPPTPETSAPRTEAAPAQSSRVEPEVPQPVEFGKPAMYSGRKRISVRFSGAYDPDAPKLEVVQTRKGENAYYVERHDISGETGASTYTRLSESLPLREAKKQAEALLRAERERLVADAADDVVGETPQGNLFDSRRAGGAVPEVVGALARVGGGAVAGSVAGAAVAPEGMEKEFAAGGALAGAGLGTAAARRALKKAPAPTLKYSTDPDVLAVAASVGVKPKAKPPLSAGKDILDTVGRWLHYKASRDVLPMENYGEVVGKSKALRNTLAQVRGQSAAAYQHLEDALTPVLRLRDKAPLDVHALARAERGLELAKLHDKLATPEQIRQWEKTVAELGSVPEVREAVDALRKYFRNLLEMKRDVGLITAEKFDEITKNADAYIPTIPDDVVASLKRGVGGNRYAPNRTAGVRKMGKELNDKDIVDPFEQAIYDTMETFARVGKQRIANVIVGMAEANPQEALAFLREVKPSRGPGGMIIPPKPEKEGATIIDAIINGKRKFYEVTDKDLADSWATFTPPVQSVAMKVLSASKQLVQEGVTGNPIFPLANGIRDFFMSGVQYPIFTGGWRQQIGKAGLTLGGGAAVGAATNEDNRVAGAAAGAGIAGTLIGVRHTGKHIARTLSAMNDILGPQVMGSVLGGIGGAFAGKEQDHPFIGFLAGLTVGTAGGRAARNLLAGNPEVYKEFIRNGGGGFGFYAKTTKDAKRIEAQLLKDGVSASDFVSPRSWWDAIQYVSRAVETAPRLALYKHLRKEGKDVGTAIFRARDLSLDFSVRPGSRMLRAGTDIVPFLNPTIQGGDKLVRLLTNPRTVGTAAATILAPTVALWALNHASPEMSKAYDGRPNYEKNNYWLVPKVLSGGQVGEFWRVPKPFEVGFIYASLPERVLDYTQQSDPELLDFALKDMFRQYAEGFTGMPAIIAPQLDIRKGEHGFDPFRRREIDPFPQKELPAEFQYDDRTSTAAIALGKVLPGEQSPAKIDYALRGYTGTLGGEFLDITSKAARNLGWDDRPEPSTRSTAFLSRFETKPESATEAELSVRRKFATAEKQYNALKQLLADGQPEKALKYAERHRETLVQYYDLQEKMTELGEVSKARRAIAKADIPAAKKREMLVGVNAIVSEILSRNASAATK